MISLRIVLVQPRNPLNILAAARAARNFGLGDIAVVDVYPRAWTEALEKDVDRETPHGPRGSSRGWLGDARKFDALIDAIGDCDWVLGTSSLERRRVNPDEVIDLRELPARIADACGPGSGSGDTLHPASQTLRSFPRQSRIAILFGSEKRGLTNEHLMHCRHVIRIPTAAGMPSMNLGQAVAVVAYELARSGVVGSLGTPRAAGETGSGGSEAGAEVAKLSEFPVGTESSEVAESSKYPRFSGGSANALNAPGAPNAEAAKVSESSVYSENAGNTTGTEFSESPELAENAKESKESANAAERHALVEQIADLIKDNSVSSNYKRQRQLGIRRRNLQKLITRLPLTKADVRLLLGVVKDAKNASSAPAEETENSASTAKT